MQSRRTGFNIREGSEMIRERIEKAELERKVDSLQARIRMTRACLIVLDKRLGEELRRAA